MPDATRARLVILLTLVTLAAIVPVALVEAKSDREVKDRLQRLKMLRATKQYYEDALSEPDSWFVPRTIPKAVSSREPLRGVVAVPGDRYIKLITIDYYESLLSTGRRFNRAELTARIKKARDTSMALRTEMEKKRAQLNKEIVQLEKEAREMMDSGTDLGRREQCRDDSWRGLWRVTANVPKYLDQSGKQRVFLDNPGWKEHPQRLGDADPPNDRGVSGVRYMHPLDGQRPAIQMGEFDLTGAKRLRIRVSGNCHNSGDFELRLKVDGQARGAERVDCGWRDVTFDLAGYRGKHTLALEVHATGWFYEYAFFDCIVLE